MSEGQAVDTVVEPVEPVEVVEPVVAEEGKEQVETNAEPKEPEEPKKQEHANRAQKRIDKLTREKYLLQGELEAMRRMQGVNAQPQPEADQKPTRAQFQSDDEFIEALTDYKVSKAMSTAESKITQTASKAKIETAWSGKVESARKEYADFDDVLEDVADVAISDAVSDAIIESDFGPDIQYYLAKNPAEVDRLNALSPASAARAIGRIEAGIEAQKAKGKPAVKPSAAPEPIKPVKASGAVEKSLYEITDPKEYAKRRGYIIK